MPNYSALGLDLVRLLTERGLGAIPKRDLDALLLYLLEKHMGWASETNQQLSIRLRLPVPKIKALRYEGALRYTEDLDAEFRTRLRRLLRQASFQLDSDAVEFIVEDYGTRFVLEEYLKKKGRLARWQFNDEGVSVPADAIASLIADQFDERDRQAAMERLGIADPSTLAAKLEAGFIELVESAKSHRVVKLTELASQLSGMTAGAKAVFAVLFG